MSKNAVQTDFMQLGHEGPEGTSAFKAVKIINKIVCDTSEVK